MALVDYFLNIDGVDGESTDDAHEGEMDILSWSWGEVNTGTSGSGGGSGAGKVSMQDIHFTAKISKASPRLLSACATGEHFDEAVLTCRKAGKGQQEFLIFTFGDLFVSSYQTGGSADGDIVPVDQFSLNFTTIDISYSPQKEDGSLDSAVEAGYDQAKNKST